MNTGWFKAGLVCLLVWSAGVAPASEWPLVTTNAEWRYVKGTNEASWPDLTAWRTPGFADSSWTAAPAPFYAGQSWTGTELDGLTNYSCIYLRRAVVVTNLTAFPSARLEAWSDDGFVAWINGVEVVRYNVPGEPLWHDAFALSEVPDPLTEVRVSVADARAWLLPGTNMLAVQAFRFSSSTDLVFLASLSLTNDDAAPFAQKQEPAPSATVRVFNHVQVTFNEPVTGVDATDLRINGNPATRLRILSETDYVFEFPQPAAGVAEVTWRAGHGIQDRAPVPNAFVGTGWTYLVDPAARVDLLLITEFMAVNSTGIRDENNDASDWIEVFNAGTNTVRLQGWYLTDNRASLMKWAFPPGTNTLAPGRFQVVFASGKDRGFVVGNPHTNFKLGGGGGYLGLILPDGFTIASEFAPVYPPQSADISFGYPMLGSLVQTDLSLAMTPTPGAPNQTPGPAIGQVAFAPDNPRGADNILVTARVSPLAAPLESVVVRYRIMFGPEIELAMFDDGQHGDGSAGDGVYGQTLPSASVVANGQLIRWYFRAADLMGRSSRWPLFRSPTDPEYLGTVVNPDSVASQLPVFHLFVAPGQVASIDAQFGGRISIFHDGELYDNIYMVPLDNPSVVLEKTSHRLAFHQNQEFRHPGPGGGVRKSLLLAEYTDASRLRRHLSYWFLNLIGVPAPFDYPVRLQTNGVFYMVAMHSDDLGKDSVERLGYDPAGALYKNVGNVTVGHSSTAGFEKLEPDEIPSTEDYDELAIAIGEWNALASRKAAVFDRLDVPEVINYLAGARWCSENNDVWSSMSLYRDTEGDELWRIVPFDMSTSWGQRFGGNSPLEATVDSRKSHPLYGGPAIDPGEGPAGALRWNRLYDVVISVPETREMLLRRMRTILDRWVLRPGTPIDQLPIESYIRSLTNLMAPDLALDNAKWPAFSAWPPAEPFLSACTNILLGFAGPRRAHWYGTHCITNNLRPTGIHTNEKAGIPLTQPAFTLIALEGMDFSPLSGDQDQEYVCLTNRNAYAVDISGWKLSGSVEFTFAPGTVMPSNSALYASPNVVAFKQRGISPRGGQGLFVVGPYQGRLSARGGALALCDPDGFQVFSNSYAGNPSPAQQFLRITELMYNPPWSAGDPYASTEYEFVELMNIGPTNLDLAGVHFAAGIDFRFTPTVLGAGQRLVLVRDAEAFVSRYGTGPVLGGAYAGALADAGERLLLLDAANEVILDFSYEAAWHPITAGAGFSLAVVNELAPPDSWGRGEHWRPGGMERGSPGQADTSLAPPSAVVLVNEVLSHPAPPNLEAIELWNSSASVADISYWYLSDDLTVPKKFRFPAGTSLPGFGYLALDEYSFNPRSVPAVAGAFGFHADGESIYLFSGDEAGCLTGYMHGFRFGPAERNGSFGRYVTSLGEEHFVPQKSLSLAESNSGPRIGPVVISEILYHPPDALPGEGGAVMEFIELFNITEQSIALMGPTNSYRVWVLRGSVEFEFPTNLVLPPRGRLLVVSFNPETSRSALEKFQDGYLVPPGIPIVGPYRGTLPDESGTVELGKPFLPIDPAAMGEVPFVSVDRVNYLGVAPWPEGAHGLGASLSRVDGDSYGDDPASWRESVPTPGAVPGASSPTITRQPEDQQVTAGDTVQFSVEAAGQGSLHYQWRRSGTNRLAGATNSILILSNVVTAESGDYNCAVTDAAGLAISRNANLTVMDPTITFGPQPTNLAVRVPPDLQAASNRTAVLAVNATTTRPPLSYRWQRGGVNLPVDLPRYFGVTNNVLTITNVVLEDGGTYRCAVSDAVSTRFSPEIQLITLVGPIFIEQPRSQTILQGDSVTFTVRLSNVCNGPFNYIWRYQSAIFASNHMVGDYFNSITVTNFALQSSNLNRYRCDVQSPVTLGQGVAGTFAFITVLADADRDRIPDDWERQFGLSTNDAADAQTDLDQDRMSNLDEYRAGTDPLDPANVLKVTGFQLGPTNTFEFLAISNRTYSVLYKESLGASPWLKLADLPGESTNRMVTIQDAAPLSQQRFYRLTTPRLE